MILFTLCNSCLQTYELLIEPGDVALVRQIADQAGHTCPCPRLCGGNIALVPDMTVEHMSQDPRLKKPIHLSGKQLFQAVNGLGLPDEVPKTSGTIKLALNCGVIKDWELEEENGKFYLHSISLGNGVTIHLGSGIRGAQVLKMTEVVGGTGNHR